MKKKNYITPQIEVIELQLEGAILGGSGKDFSDGNSGIFD